MKRIVLALTLIAITTGAMAHFPKIAARLRQIDSNHDQSLSLNEAMAARQQRFALLDLNKDRALSVDELSQNKAAAQANARAERRAQRFARLDKNQDRFVSQSEWDAGVAQLFARFDANNDQQITRAEFRAARAKRCR